MYFATSSSESEDENLHYECFGTKSCRRTPFYPGLGHPLIYYAEVKPKRRNRRSRDSEKNNSNCFVKAFRWYTKEHVPFKNNNSSNNIINKDMKGFATWLDEKYCEYQTDRETNRIEKTQCILSQRSTVEVMNGAKIYDNKIQGSKKFPILRSPWNKREKSLNTRDENDFTVKSNQSIKIILNPKNLSRPASECCQRSDLQNNAIISNMSALHVKLKPTSKSLTSVLKEKEIYIIPFEFFQDASYEKLLKIKGDGMTSNERKKIKQIFPKESRVKSSRNDVSCHCNNTFENISRKIEKNKTNTCHCYKRKSVEEVEVIRKIAVIPKMTPNQPNTRDHESSVKQFVSDCVQTSNYSINLDYVSTQNKPVFMKIMCPQKIKENCD